TVLETGCPGTPSQRSSQRRTDLFTSRRQRILIDESEPESSAPPGKRAVRLISLWRPSRLRSPRRNSPAPSGPRQCVGLALAAAAGAPPHPSCSERGASAAALALLSGDRTRGPARGDGRPGRRTTRPVSLPARTR